MYTGPNTITDGLVLSLDAANIKSFKGEPTVNLINNGDFTNGVTNWSVSTSNNGVFLNTYSVKTSPKPYLN